MYVYTCIQRLRAGRSLVCRTSVPRMALDLHYSYVNTATKQPVTTTLPLKPYAPHPETNIMAIMDMFSTLASPSKTFALLAFVRIYMWQVVRSFNIRQYQRVSYIVRSLKTSEDDHTLRRQSRLFDRWCGGCGTHASSTNARACMRMHGKKRGTHIR